MQSPCGCMPLLPAGSLPISLQHLAAGRADPRPIGLQTLQHAHGVRQGGLAESLHVRLASRPFLRRALGQPGWGIRAVKRRLRGMRRPEHMTTQQANRTTLGNIAHFSPIGYTTKHARQRRRAHPFEFHRLSPQQRRLSHGDRGPLPQRRNQRCTKGATARPEGCSPQRPPSNRGGGARDGANRRPRTVRRAAAGYANGPPFTPVPPLAPSVRRSSLMAK